MFVLIAFYLFLTGCVFSLEGKGSYTGWELLLTLVGWLVVGETEFGVWWIGQLCNLSGLVLSAVLVSLSGRSPSARAYLPILIRWSAFSLLAGDDWALSNKVLNRLVHSLNGNIQGKFVWILVLIVIGMVALVADFLTGFKIGFLGSSPRVTREAFKTTKAFVIKASMMMGFFGIPLAALALIVSPVFFVWCLVFNFWCVIRIYQLSSQVDVVLVKQREETAQALRKLRILEGDVGEHGYRRPAEEAFKRTGIWFEGEPIDNKFVCSKACTPEQLAAVQKMKDIRWVEVEGLIFFQRPTVGPDPFADPA